jgi:hypothetical protein
VHHPRFHFSFRRLIFAVATVVVCAIGVGVLTGAGGMPSTNSGYPYYLYYPGACPGDNRSPVADFMYSPASPRPGEVVTFTSTSTDANGDPLLTGWDFDGDWNPSQGVQDLAHVDQIGPVAHFTYGAPGDYRVRMGVEDVPCGAGALIDKIVRVEAAGGGGPGGGGPSGGGGAGGGGPSGGGGPVGGGPPPDKIGPTVVIASVNKTRRVSRTGVFTFILGPFLENVTGTIVFESVAAVVAQNRKKKLKIAPRRSSVAKGKRLAIRTKLPKKGRQALRRRNRVRMRARVALRDSLGNASTRTFLFTLKAPRRKG